MDPLDPRAPRLPADRPRIAIDPELVLEGGEAGSARVSLPLRYVAAVERAGGAPVVLAPCGPEALDAVLDGIDGLLLSGGDDFDTERLGLGPTHPRAKPVPSAKQDFDLDLVRRALERDLPVLGVCFGMQCLGLAAGGGLHQHLPDDRPELPSHSGGVRHEVELVAGTKLAAAAGVSRCVVVSRHHQALSSVPEPWIVSARSGDGLIEAIERPDRSFAVGVQWHPELAEPGGADDDLFRAFVEAARATRHTLFAPGGPTT